MTGMFGLLDAPGYASLASGRGLGRRRAGTPDLPAQRRPGPALQVGAGRYLRPGAGPCGAEVTGLLEGLRGRLVVSCQADVGSSLRHPSIMAAMARAAELGGAGAIRVQGVADVTAVRVVTSLPLIGLTKTDRPDTDVYITPTADEALRLHDLGCEIVAADVTLRPRPQPFAQIVRLVHAAGGLVMADISTLEEARQALLDGADVLSTTLSGYTPYSPQLTAPDWPLMHALKAEGLLSMAEGCLSSPAQARYALDLGALAVVIGSAITRPDVITRGFAQGLNLPSGRGEP